MSTSKDFLLAKEQAVQQYEGARHLLNVTYRTVKDPKILLGVMDNLISSFEHSVDAILAYERLLRLVPVYSNNWTSKFNLFRSKSARRNNISPQHISMYLEMKETLDLHKKSPMAFQRGNKLIICNSHYKLKTLSLKDLQQYLEKTKKFLSNLDLILSKH